MPKYSPVSHPANVSLVPAPITDFASENEAAKWMYDVRLAGEECFDNYRFAFLDDEAARNAYADDRELGCCGYFDTDRITINGRQAMIGCNFGH